MQLLDIEKEIIYIPYRKSHKNLIKILLNSSTLKTQKYVQQLAHVGQRYGKQLAYACWPP